MTATRFGSPDAAGAAAAAITPPGPHPHPAWPAALAVTSATQQPSVRTGGGPPQQPRAEASAISTGTWHTPVSGRTSCTLSAAVEIAGDRRRDRPRLLVAGEQQEGRRPPVALDADRVEVRLRMGELAIAVRLRPSRRNADSDRSSAPGPSRFRARDPARGAARGSWSDRAAAPWPPRSGRPGRSGEAPRRFRPQARSGRRRPRPPSPRTQ